MPAPSFFLNRLKPACARESRKRRDLESEGIALPAGPRSPHKNWGWARVNQLLHGNRIIDILQKMLSRALKRANDQKEEGLRELLLARRTARAF